MALRQTWVVELTEILAAYRLEVETAIAAFWALPVRPVLDSVALRQARIVELAIVVTAHRLPVIAAIAFKFVQAFRGLHQVFGTRHQSAHCAAIRQAFAHIASVKVVSATFGAEIGVLGGHALANLRGRGATYIHELTLLARVALPMLPASACSHAILASICAGHSQINWTSIFAGVSVDAAPFASGPGTAGNCFAVFSRQLKYADILNQGALPVRPGFDPVAGRRAWVVKLTEVLAAHRLPVVAARAVFPGVPGDAATLLTAGPGTAGECLTLFFRQLLHADILNLGALSVRPGLDPVALRYTRVVKLPTVFTTYRLPDVATLAVNAPLKTLVRRSPHDKETKQDQTIHHISQTITKGNRV